MHRDVHRQRGSYVTSTRNNRDVCPYHLNNFTGRIRGTMHEDLIGLTLEHTFPNSSVATAITVGTKAILIKYLSSS
jgi:hypothetical protein